VTQPRRFKGGIVTKSSFGKGEERGLGCVTMKEEWALVCHNERNKMSFWPFWVRWRVRFCSWLRYSLHPWDRWETSISMPAHKCGPLCATVRPGHLCDGNESSPSCFFDLWLRVRHGTAKCMWFVCRVDSCTSASYRKTWARNIMFYFGKTGRIRLAGFIKFRRG
jgi:hypothetical protein